MFPGSLSSYKAESPEPAKYRNIETKAIPESGIVGLKDSNIFIEYADNERDRCNPPVPDSQEKTSPVLLRIHRDIR